MEGVQWTDQKFEWTPFQSLRCRSRERECRGKESPSETSTSSEPRLDVQAAMQSRTTERAQAHSERCRKRIEERLGTTPHGAERLDRRIQMINEASTEEVRREEQRNKRSDRVAAAIPETKPAAPAVSEPREDPIEPDPNPKRRPFMKSSSLTASGSGQQGETKATPDDESRMQVEDKLEMDTE